MIMFDFNTISIKTTEDLQEALRVECCKEQFTWQVKGMIDRWGLEETLASLYYALYGNGDEVKPMIKVTHRYKPMTNLYDDAEIEEIKDDRV